MHAGALRIESPNFNLRSLPGSGTIGNDAAEVAHAANALGRVLAAKHFENYIHAFAVSQIFDGLFVILFLVVNSVLQAERLDAIKFFVG